jgi:NADPH:quinone reductase-like Zn-dependent oxidoreductase
MLTEKGIYISTELGKGLENIYLALFTPFLRGKKVLFPIPTIHREDAEFIRQLAEQGHFKPVIDRAYRLHQIIEAYTYVESGQKTGNVLLKIID